MTEKEAHISVRNLTMAYGDFVVMRDLSFTINRRDVFIIMGGSGCGKSTLLRHLIGLLKPDKGSIKIFGSEITTMREKEINEIRKKFGILFQSGALFNSLSVGENIALLLKVMD